MLTTARVEAESRSRTTTSRCVASLPSMDFSSVHLCLRRHVPACLGREANQIAYCYLKGLSPYSFTSTKSGKLDPTGVGVSSRVERPSRMTCPLQTVRSGWPPHSIRPTPRRRCCIQADNWRDRSSWREKTRRRPILSYLGTLFAPRARTGPNFYGASGPRGWASTLMRGRFAQTRRL
jgi:hypothetical protein